MSFRFLRLTTVYPEFVRQFLGQHADHRYLSYAALYRRLSESGYAESDHHAVHLRRLGHDAAVFFTSVEPLQKRWAEEQGLRYRSRHWFEDIAVAQVAAFQPDVLFLDDLYAMGPALRRRLREACHQSPYVVGWRAAPTDAVAAMKDLDLVLSSIRSLVAEFRAAGIAAEHLHHGFEDSLLDDVPPARERSIAASFAGGLGAMHAARATLVETLMDQVPLQVWGGPAQLPWKDRLRWQLRRWGFPQKQKSRLRTLALNYPGRVHPAVFGRDYYRVLADSQIVLNCHISCAAHDASNMRLFEATGMGACLVTDEKPNLAELFEPGIEVVVYRSPAECVDRVRYLLAHDSERKRIAAAGQRRTLQQHRFAQRMEQLAALLRPRLARAAA